MIFAIDDARYLPSADVVVRGPEYAWELFINVADKVTELWLDHDLGEGKDIREFVRTLEERFVYHQEGGLVGGIFNPDMKVLILSSNPAGRKYIQQALEKHFQIINFTNSQISNEHPVDVY